MSSNPTTHMEASELDLNTNQWADLPKDVLLRIIRLLDLKTDLPRIRGVCPTWRSALPLSDFPMSKSHFEVPSVVDGDNLPYFLVETIIYFLSPLNSSANDSDPSGWIARMVEIGENKWHLIIPFMSPWGTYLTTEPPVTGEINLLDCRVIELARPLSLFQGLDSKSPAISSKVVGEWDLTSSNLSAVLVLLKKKNGGGLLMLKSGDQEWVKIDGIRADEIPPNMDFSVLDIAFHKGKFYFFQMMSGFDDWRVGIINPSDSSISLQFKSGFTRITEDGVSLVPSQINDCVYLLLNNGLFGDKVVLQIKDSMEYEMMGELKPVQILDEILYIGDDVSFTLNVICLQQISPWNSISVCMYYFTFDFDDFLSDVGIRLKTFHIPEGAGCLKSVNALFIGKNLHCFVLKNGVLRLNNMSKEDRRVRSKLFFPPPAWVKWCCPSLDNVEVKLDGLQYWVEGDERRF